MSSSIGEGLVAIGEDIQANPMIAKSWDVSDDFLTWTWKLQDGIQFHKGYGEMTAEDVAYSAEQFHLGAKLARAGIMGDYWGYNGKGNSSTEIIDDLTLVVTNSKPWVPAVVFEFSRNAAGVSFWAVSKKQSEELGIEKASVDIASTGPWEIVDHESGSFWRFKAVEDHWRQTPYFEELVFWTIPEESARVAGFLTGSLDIFTMAFDSLPIIEAVEGAVVTGWANGGQAGLNFYGQLNGLTKDGEEYTINGTKTFITNGRYGDMFCLLARTDPDMEPRHKGISCFVVEKGGAGFTVGKDLDKLGYRGLDTCELIFDNFAVPQDNLIGGKEGAGFGMVMSGLETGRINIAARAVGVAQAAFEAAIKYSQGRETFGKPISEHQAIQLKLADMATKIQAARLLVYDAAAKKDTGQRVDLESGMAKLFASEVCLEVTMDSMRVHGGAGYIKDLPVERYYRDAPLMVIGEGTNEIMRLVIAKQLLRLPEYQL